MRSPEHETIQALRRDIAHQLARYISHLGSSQLARSKCLGIPQPTLSKIVNGRVTDLSLELLLRIAVRAHLPLLLQTGSVPEESGVYVAGTRRGAARIHSRSSEATRTSMAEAQRRLTSTERLQAFLEHNQLMHELHISIQGKRNSTRPPRR